MPGRLCFDCCLAKKMKISPELLQQRQWWIALSQMLMVALSLLLAFLLRFEFSIPEHERAAVVAALPIAVAAKSLVFWGFGLFRGWWQFATIADLARIGLANVAASLLFTAICRLIVGPTFSRSVYALDFLICFLLAAGARFAVRIYNEALFADVSQKRHTRGLLIYGAGKVGVALLRDIQRNSSLGCEVIGFLDDNLKKVGEEIGGVRVLGTGSDAQAIAEASRTRIPSVDEVVIAMPSADKKQMRDAVANCRKARVAFKTVPRIDELLDTNLLSSQIREVSVEDLLGRDPVQLQEDKIREDLQGRVVMVTGAAGSIGSELCRQILRFEPKLLVALDQAETPLFHLEAELRRRAPGVPTITRIADIRDKSRLAELIITNRIDSVFHAAAYKHVPVMEANVLEAVRNNVIGTWNLATAAYENGVRSFVMISSDKAVNPSSVMGLTKRIAELIVSAMSSDAEGATRFVSVRFGNVLGSSGSVVPLFREQILAGGPVVVTHADATRYFMTIKEAVQLVLQAAALGQRSEIFMLDMGEPVRIVDLARNMIRLSGLEPDEDIQVTFSGLRPGEKLFEELHTSDEDIVATQHPKVHIVRCSTVSRGEMERWIQATRRMLAMREEGEMISHLSALVPEYVPTEFREKKFRTAYVN